MQQQSKYLPAPKYLIKTEGNGIIGVGTVMLFSGEPLPMGWLECDGSEYDPEKYPELHKRLTKRVDVFERSFWDKLFGRKGKFSHVEVIELYGKNRLPDFRGRIVAELPSEHE